MRMILPRAIDRFAENAAECEQRGSSIVSRTTVQLRHTLPDNSHHFDWLLDVAGDNQSPLTTFRLPAPLHELMAGRSMQAQRIDDHRRSYLDYEGPISGERGSVEKVTAGRICELHREAGEWNLTIEWTENRAQSNFTGARQTLLLRCTGNPGRPMQTWMIFCLPSSGDSP